MTDTIGLSCALRRKDCEKTAKYVCHHCGRPLCGNSRSIQEITRKNLKKIENFCCVLFEDIMFPEEDIRNFNKGENRSMGTTQACHCPECFLAHHKR